MKLTTTTVVVGSTELNDSRSKEPVTDACREVPPESTTEVRTGQPQSQPSRDDPHRMSSESTTTGEPSRSADGEGCQQRDGQPLRCSLYSTEVVVKASRM